MSHFSNKHRETGVKLVLGSNPQIFRHPVSWLAAVLCLSLVMTFMQHQPALAQTIITVNTTADELNADGDCSLREAIQAANTNTAVDACPAGGATDLIKFADDIAGGTITLVGSFLTITDSDLTIQGPETGITIHGADAFGIKVEAAAHVLLSKLTITRGGDAGISNLGWLRLENCTITNNYGYDAGGIRNAGAAATLFLVNSTVSGNWAIKGVSNTGAGGGIRNHFFAQLYIYNSTISHNYITTNNGVGGIWNYYNPTVTYRNAIVANNTYNGQTGPTLDCNAATLVDEGHNLIETGACLTDTTNGNILGQDPRLAALADNGGATWTHALLTDSPALNAGNNASCEALDQRGIARPNGAACDIGAVEMEISFPEIDVRGNGVAIANDDTTPSPSDDTDFGSMNVSSGTVVRTFTIQNTGNAELSVSPPTLSGANASDFAISSAPAASVAANGSTTFQVTFDPSAVGVRTATVSIANDDSDENPYIFTIQGTGMLPAPSLSIPTTSLDASNGAFSVPVNFTSDGAAIASVGFALDYEENCLTFDATDANNDDIPDAISGLPSGFVASISHDANDTAGELDISFFDNTFPIGVLSDGALLTVAFTVKPACITTDGTTHNVTLNFAGDPAPSFSDALANDVTGTSSGATIPLHFNATPTAINLDNSNVAENAASGTTVGTLSTVDPDSGDSHTYALVSGSGDSDNASFVLDGATLKTAASFDFETKSNYSIRLRTTDNGGLNGTFEQALTINVTNVNEAPVAVADPQDPLTTIFVGGQATAINVLGNDTDEDGDTLTVASVDTTGTQGSVTNNGADVSYTAPNSNGSSSFTYQAGDGALNSNSATVNVAYVKNDLRGDCNANGSVTAADFVATILEIFDTNDTKYNGNPAWWQIYSGDYAGSPRGCDANAGKNGLNNSSDSVSAGDIVCTVLIFFKGSCGASGVTAGGQQATAQLAVADASAQPGQMATVTVNFNPAGNQVAAASFALVIDSSKLSFDPTDADGDGVPDAVQLTVPASMNKSVQWNAAQSRLEVAIFGASLPLPTLSAGALATINVQVAATATPGATELGIALASLGDTEGQDVAVDQSNGALTITDGAVRNLLYLPVVVR